MEENDGKESNVIPQSDEYNPDKLLVQKSIPLILMKEVPFNYGELRLLDLYLSLINSHDMSHNRVELPLSQYCKIMGIKEPHTDRLRRCMKDLVKPVQIPASYIKDIGETELETGYCTFPLFDVADVGSKKNRNIVILECSQRARQLFFNIESIKYVKYTLSVLLSLSNKNSILFYQYLLKAQFDRRAVWTVSVDDFKELCFKKDPITYYTEFKHFKQKVLDPSVKEINEKTGMDISYLLKREKGKSIDEIEFTLTEDTCPDAVPPRREPSLDCREERSDNMKEKRGNPPTRYVERNNNAPQKQQSQPQQKTAVRKVYAKEFEEFWKAYPRKEDKSMAYEKYNACINAGYRADELLTAAERYAAQCQRNHTEQRYIKMARTFLGPNHPFEEFLDAVVKEEDTELTEEELEEKERLDEFLKTRIKLKVPDENGGGQEEEQKE